MDPLGFYKNRKKQKSRPAGTIIPIASGKGGANLHSFLGISNRYPGIGDFLKARIAGLDELLVPSAISFITKFFP